MISITQSTFDQKSFIEVKKEHIKIITKPSIGFSLIANLVFIELFSWGVTIFLTDDYSFGIITTIMFVIFIGAVVIIGKRVITINPETRKIYSIGWSDNVRIKWSNGMILRYERIFDEQNTLTSIRLFLTDQKEVDTTITIFETEDQFFKFVELYNKKYPDFTLQL